jgi:hypothetical protein
MKWRLYDELLKKKLLAKIGVEPPVTRTEATRGDTGSLPTGSPREKKPESNQS